MVAAATPAHNAAAAAGGAPEAAEQQPASLALAAAAQQGGMQRGLFSRRGAAQAAAAAARTLEAASAQDAALPAAAGGPEHAPYYRSLQAELEQLTGGAPRRLRAEAAPASATGRRARRLAVLTGKTLPGPSHGTAVKGEEAAPVNAAHPAQPSINPGSAADGCLGPASPPAAAPPVTPVDGAIRPKPPSGCVGEAAAGQSLLSPTDPKLQDATAGSAPLLTPQRHPAALPGSSQAIDVPSPGDDWWRAGGFAATSPPPGPPPSLKPLPPPPCKAAEPAPDRWRSSSPLVTPPPPRLPLPDSPTAGRVEMVDHACSGGISPTQVWANAFARLEAQSPPAAAATWQHGGQAERPEVALHAVNGAAWLKHQPPCRQASDARPAARSLTFSPEPFATPQLSPWQRQQQQLQQECAQSQETPLPPAPPVMAAPPVCTGSPITPPAAVADGAQPQIDLHTSLCRPSAKRVRTA